MGSDPGDHVWIVDRKNGAVTPTERNVFPQTGRALDGPQGGL